DRTSTPYARDKFTHGVAHSCVPAISGASHYVFLSNPDDTEQSMMLLRRQVPERRRGRCHPARTRTLTNSTGLEFSRSRRGRGHDGSGILVGSCPQHRRSSTGTDSSANCVVVAACVWFTWATTRGGGAPSPSRPGPRTSRA